jgi:hypothetical protein
LEGFTIRFDIFHRYGYSRTLELLVNEVVHLQAEDILILPAKKQRLNPNGLGNTISHK